MCFYVVTDFLFSTRDSVLYPCSQLSVKWVEIAVDAALPVDRVSKFVNEQHLLKPANTRHICKAWLLILMDLLSRPHVLASGHVNSSDSASSSGFVSTVPEFEHLIASMESAFTVIHELNVEISADLLRSLFSSLTKLQVSVAAPHTNHANRINIGVASPGFDARVETQASFCDQSITAEVSPRDFVRLTSSCEALIFFSILMCLN